jgi:hypothetical protein
MDYFESLESMNFDHGYPHYNIDINHQLIYVLLRKTVGIDQKKNKNT